MTFKSFAYIYELNSINLILKSNSVSNLKNFPNISFQGQEKTMEFEFLSLSNLFDRVKVGLDHNPSLPHRINFFALLMVTNGTGSHQIDLETYPLEKGSLLKIAKGQVHAFQENPQYEGFLIIFTEAFVLNNFSKSSINLISHLYNYHLSTPLVNDKIHTETFLDQLILELADKNTYAQKNIVAALLELFLLRLERNAQHQNQQKNISNQYNTFVQFKNLVETHYTKTRNVMDYADMMLISTKQLNQVVKDYTLTTAKTFIDNYIILETKRAIVSTQKSFKEIAFDIGFDEVTNFTKFFKNKMGISPKTFRLGQ